MTEYRRLRDGLYLLTGREHAPRGSTDNWRNTARHMGGWDAVPGSAATFVTNSDGDHHWAFLAGANQALTTSRTPAQGFDFSLIGGRTVFFRGRFSNLSNGNAFLVGKKNTISSSAAGWAICRNSTTEGISAYVSDGTTQHQLNGSITYATTFVAALTWDGPTSTSTLYINGTQAATSSTALAADPAATAISFLHIGRQGANDTIWPYGQCKAVAMFPVALTATEVAAFTTDLNTPPDEIVIGRTLFNDTGPNENSLVWFGDGFHFSADIYPGTESEARAMRLELLGLKPGDVVPVTWSADPDVDGFYRLTNPVECTPVAAYLNVWRFSCAFSMERVGGGFGLPAHEVRTMTAPRDGNTLTAGSWTNAVSVGLPALLQWAEGADYSEYHRAAGGLLNVRPFLSAVYDTVTTPEEQSSRYVVPPYAALDHAATIEYKDDTGEWRPLVGLQLPAYNHRNPHTVRMSSGGIRLTWALNGDITMELLAWEGWVTTPSKFEFTQGGAGVPYKDRQFVPTSVVVTKNEYHEIAAEFYGSIENLYPIVGEGFLQAWVAVSMRRGQHHATLTTKSQANSHRFGPTSNVACDYIDTTKSQGLVKTTDDANGNRFLLDTTESGAVVSTTRGDLNVLTLDDGATFTVMLGMEHIGGNATSDSDGAVANNWWIATDESHRIISL